MSSRIGNGITTGDTHFTGEKFVQDRGCGYFEVKLLHAICPSDQKLATWVTYRDSQGTIRPFSIHNGQLAFPWPCQLASFSQAREI